MKYALISAAALAVMSSAANAATFQLSYTDLGGFEYTASITADLDTDKNTLINITSDSLTVDGTSYTTAIVGSLSGAFGGSGLGPLLTLDGSVVDFYVADAGGVNGFAFEYGRLGFNISYTSLLPFVTYNPAGYSLVETTAAPVPLPAGLPLALTGIAGLAVLRRRAA